MRGSVSLNLLVIPLAPLYQTGTGKSAESALVSLYERVQYTHIDSVQPLRETRKSSKRTPRVLIHAVHLSTQSRRNAKFNGRQCNLSLSGSSNREKSRTTKDRHLRLLLFYLSVPAGVRDLDTAEVSRLCNETVLITTWR